MNQPHPFLVVFEPVHARFVRLTILGVTRGEAVSLRAVTVYAPGSTENLASSARGARVTVSSTIAGDPAALISGQEASSPWRAATSGPEWVEIELPEVALVDAIAFQTDNTTGEPSSYRVDVGFRPLSAIGSWGTQMVAFHPGPGGGLRAPVTADRQGLISAEPPPSLPPFERVPRGQRKTREYSPQWHPAGESLCLNGNNWWLCQVPGGPHDGCWPPDLERLAELARNLPSGGDGSGTP